MSSWKRRCAALAIATISLSGCAATSSECPPIPPYTADEQERAADEILRLPPDVVMIPRMLADYAMLRDQIRACR